MILLKNTNEKEWFDSPNIITYIMTGLLIIIIVLSQSFAIQNHLGAAEILRSIFNYNSIYVIALAYFILIRTKTGKRYFDYLNVIMAILYLLMSVASFFTVFQSFGLASLINLALNILLTLYFIYSFICDTELGKELKISVSPLAEINNGQYFYLIMGLLIINLVVSLMAAISFDNVVLSLLEVMYLILFARYIYLYKEYSENKKEKKEHKKSETSKKVMTKNNATSKKNNSQIKKDKEGAEE